MRRLLLTLVALIVLGLPAFGQGTAFTTVFNTGSLPAGWQYDNEPAPGAISGVNSGTFTSANCAWDQGVLDIKLTQTGSAPVISTGCMIQTTATYGYGTYHCIFRPASTSPTPFGTGSAVSGSDSSCFTIDSGASNTEIDFPEIEGQLPNQLEWTNWHTTSAKQYSATQFSHPEAGFHDASFTWQPGRIDFFWDGVLVATHTLNVPTLAAHILTSLWGTNSTSFGGLASVGVTRHQYVKQISYTPLGGTSTSGTGSYYVATTGNDSNPGTQASPWLTPQHCIDNFVLTSTGATCHVAQGTYSHASGLSCTGGQGPAFCIGRGGSSTTALFRLVCDDSGGYNPNAGWTVPSSSSGCKLVNSSGNSQGTVIALGSVNHVVVKGFEFTGSALAQSIATTCDGHNPAITTGVCPYGNDVWLLDNYTHDMGQTSGGVAIPQGGTGCPSTGVFTGGPSHGSHAYNTGVHVAGNRFQHIGDISKARKNGGQCNQYHAVYFDTPNVWVQNNEFLDVVSFSIHQYSYPCTSVITNNTLVRDGASAITYSGGDCPNIGQSSGRGTIGNNIAIDSGQSAVDNLADGGCTSATPNLIDYNITGGGTGFAFSANVNQPMPACDQQVGNFTSSGAALFVTYLGSASQTNGNDDLHLKSTSPARFAGKPSCVTGGITPCVPALDMDGNQRSLTTPSIGAHDIAGNVTPPPTPGNEFWVASTGNDSNDGSQAHPFLTVAHAISSFTLSTTGATIHVGTGTWPGIDVTRGGSSPAVRLVLKCDAGAASVLAAIGQCNVHSTIGFANFGIYVEANNVDVIGFDVGSDPDMGAGIVVACAASTAVACPKGNSVHILGNFVHDLAQNVDSGGSTSPPNIAGCPQAGAITGGTHLHTQTDQVFSRNFVYNYGLNNTASASCRFAHGLYFGDPAAGSYAVAQDNLIVGVPFAGITNGASCNMVWTNNTIVTAANAFTLADQDNSVCPGGIPGHNTIANNALFNSLGVPTSSPAVHVFNVSSAADCTANSPTLWSHNISDGIAADFSPARTSCDIVTPGTSTSFTHQAGTAFFTNYLPLGGDYHLSPASLGNGGGSTSCVSGGPSTCTPPADIDGALENPLSVGAFAGKAATVGSAQLSLKCGIDIFWATSTGASTYSSYRSTSAGGTYTRIASQLAGTTYLDPAVTCSTPWYYRITAVNSVGESAQSFYTTSTPLSYPTVAIGKSLVQHATLSNTSPADSSTNVSITGSDALDFNVTGCPLILSTQTSCTLNVFFQPQSSGLKGATLNAGQNSVALFGGAATGGPPPTDVAPRKLVVIF
jgi:hypothetical protein